MKKVQCGLFSYHPHTFHPPWYSKLFSWRRCHHPVCYCYACSCTRTCLYHSEIWQNKVMQECIPVGCVPPASMVISWEACFPRGCTRQHPEADTPRPFKTGIPPPPPPALWTEFLTHACKNRVATAQGKQGIWFLLFPDRENTGNFALAQGKILKHRENVFLWHRENFRHRENIWLWLLK